MRGLNRRHLLAGAAAFFGATLTRSADAQDYPQRAVRVIVPYAPGGASDILARLVQPHLERELGQSFVVDNRSGGASQVGTQAIATAAPDGYTIGVIDSAFVINPGLFAGKLPYDTRKDFAPVSLLAMSPLVLVVHPDVPAKSAQELVALAKAKPGEVTFASAGLGTAIHLAGEQFRQVAAIDINHIPYRGGGPSVIDLLAGKVNFTFSTVPAILEHVRGGKVRALGITGARSAHMPDVPTMAETGLAGVDSAPLFGMVTPAAVPPAIVTRLSAAASRVVKSDALNQRLIEIGYLPVGSSAEEFRARIDAEIDKWTRIIQAANIKPT
jgi:tripartite-type tricarboxylate transporter receptor subunit TctC